LKIIICVLIAYFFGAIPSGFVLGKLIRGIDIRKHGSKNIGATNTFRVLGIFPGIISFIFDFTKGFLSVQIGRWLLAENYSPGSEIFQIIIVTIGFCAIIGHIFPIYLKFKGGKGVATGAGIFVNLMPIAFLYAFVVFLLTFFISRYVSLSSIFAVICFFCVELITNIPKFNQIPYLVLTLIIMLLIIFRHKKNIKRLLNGSESRIKFGKDKLNQ